MSDFSVLNGTYPSCSYQPYPNNPGALHQPPPAHFQLSTQADPSLLIQESVPSLEPPPQPRPVSKGENARESRNKAEKQRRDKMNQSISLLASIVPPVAMAGKKVDKTSVLRFTAHYLRSHRHVFGKSIRCDQKFSPNFTKSVLRTMRGFILTTTYKGLVVVVSPNVQEYLGYTELDLLGQNLYSIIHQDDHQLLMQQLFPRSCRLTSNGELFLSNEPGSAEKAAAALKNEKRSFIIRFKKLSHQRSEPAKYLTCHVEGSFRKSDRAGVYVDNHVQIGRRVRSRGNNPYASGNDIVFIGVVRPITETFTTESRIEAFRMEYRTRHSIDGSIIQCEQRICLITGYMTHEVTGVNAMNFMHRDDVRWVVVALREMYVNHRLMGESCYRLMMKNGKFLHMRTTGALDVDPDSKEATSFVCTNTVVPEEEGKELIKQMKRKFSFQIINEELKDEDLNGKPDDDDNQSLPVEDPRQLEQVIYHLVTDLPSPRPEEARENHEISNTELAIIPPKREQIKQAIEKSYNVIKTLRQNDPTNQIEKMFTDKSDTAQNSNVFLSNDTETISGDTQSPVMRYGNVEHDYALPRSPVATNCELNQQTQANHKEVNPHEIDQLVQCRKSTTKLHVNVDKNSDDDYDIPERYNFLDSPSTFCDVFDLVPSNNVANGTDTWTSAQPSFVKLPDDSTTTYMDTSNFSFVTVDRSVTIELPDLGMSQEEIDRVLDSALNESNLFERASQACSIFSETNADDLRALEMECPEMDSVVSKIETQQKQEIFFAEKFEISQNIEQDTAAYNNDYDRNNIQLWEERQEYLFEEHHERTEESTTATLETPEENNIQSLVESNELFGSDVVNNDHMNSIEELIDEYLVFNTLLQRKTSDKEEL